MEYWIVCLGWCICNVGMVDLESWMMYLVFNHLYSVHLKWGIKHLSLSFVRCFIPFIPECDEYIRISNTGCLLLFFRHLFVSNFVYDYIGIFISVNFLYDYIWIFVCILFLYKYIRIFIRVNLCKQIFLDICLCQHFDECHTLLYTSSPHPEITIPSACSITVLHPSEVAFLKATLHFVSNEHDSQWANWYAPCYQHSSVLVQTFHRNTWNPHRHMM